MPNLPLELILLIIRQIPSPEPVAYHSSHIVTKTLLSCTLVSTASSTIATQLLYSRCAYLDNDKRLQQFSLNASDNPKLAHRVTSLVLDFHDLDPNTCLFENGSCVHQRLYIAISDLLWPIRTILRRLVVDMPMRLLSGAKCISFAMGYLHRSFISLAKIEELCSVRDELFCGFHSGSSIWADWTHLKRLVLYNVDLDVAGDLTNRFIGGLIQRKSTITHLALPRPDGYDYREQPGYHNLQLGGPGSAMKRVLIIDDHLSDRHTILETAAGIQASKESIDVPEILLVSSLPADEPDDVIEVVQHWVKTHVLANTLWDVEGIPLTRSPPTDQSDDDE